MTPTLTQNQTAMLNNVLQQLIDNRYGSSEHVPESVFPLLEDISKLLDVCEREQTVLEDCIRFNTAELFSLNRKLKTEAKELRALNRELNTIFDNLQNVFFSVDMSNNQLLHMSPACEKIYGFPVSAFTDDPKLWFDVIVEEDKEIILDGYRALYSGTALEQEYRIVHGDTSIRWVMSRITPTLGADGKLIRIDGHIADITSRKKAEQEIRMKEAHLRASQHIARLGSWEVEIANLGEIAGNKLWLSDEAFSLYGYTPGELEVNAEFFFSRVHADDQQRVIAAVDKAVRGGRNF